MLVAGYPAIALLQHPLLLRFVRALLRLPLRKKLGKAEIVVQTTSLRVPRGWLELLLVHDAMLFLQSFPPIQVCTSFTIQRRQREQDTHTSAVSFAQSICSVPSLVLLPTLISVILPYPYPESTRTGQPSDSGAPRSPDSKPSSHSMCTISIHSNGFITPPDLEGPHEFTP